GNEQPVTSNEQPTPNSQPPTPIERDPLRWLAEAAGYNDSERWWEHIVEERQNDTDVFGAILEAMTALRREVEKEKTTTHDSPLTKHEAQREAWMRRTVREAGREGFENIAVVCG